MFEAVARISRFPEGTVDSRGLKCGGLSDNSSNSVVRHILPHSIPEFTNWKANDQRSNRWKMDEPDCVSQGTKLLSLANTFWQLLNATTGFVTNLLEL